LNKAIELFYKVYQNPKLLAIATVGFFTSGVLLGLLAEQLEDSSPSWVYKGVEMLSYILVFGSFGWSLLHPFIVYSETQKQWKKHWFWIALGLVPIAYALISFFWIYGSFD
jgi:hypothetical protein